MKRWSCILKSLNIHEPLSTFVFKMYICKGNFFLYVFKKGYIKKKREIGRIARKTQDFRNSARLSCFERGCHIPNCLLQEKNY